jgi:hypothetical protein
MKLKRSQVEYVAHQVVKNLIKGRLVAADDAARTTTAVQDALTGDLMVEDRLNEEVRQILEQYADEIARGSVQYHDMFKLVKAKLVKERKLIL